MKNLRLLITLSMFGFSIISCQKQIDYQPQITLLQGQITSLQSRCDSLSKALVSSNNTVLNISAELLILTNNQNKQKLSLDSIRTQIAGILTSITNLNTQLNQQNTLISNLTTAMAQANSNIASIDSQIANINTTITTLKNQYNDLLTQLTDILNQLNIPPTLTNGLIAYYPFTGNSNDISGNGFNGINNGAVLATDRFGNSNNAYYFSGNNNIVLPFSQTNIISYSVSAWFKTSLGGVILGGRGNNGEEGLSLTVENNSLSPTYLGQVLWTSENNYGGIGQLSNLSYLDNSWHNVIGTFTSNAGNITPSEFVLYIDGVLINSINSNTSNQATTSPINNNNTNLLLGNHQLYSNAGFIGILDDIRIYNRVLTQNEITYLAQH